MTDHVHRPAQYSTLNEEEDAEFYRISQKMAEYKAEAPNKAIKRVSQFESGRYERGSFQQRIFEPLAGAKRLENGAVFYKVEHKEVTRELDEEKLRAQFERASSEEALEFGEEEADALRFALLDELASERMDFDQLNAYLDNEFAVFKAGEEYSFVRDLKDSYSGDLQKTTTQKIFETIPDHVFWDIKKPRTPAEEGFVNPYNAAREYHYQNFFDTRHIEEWLETKDKK